MSTIFFAGWLAEGVGSGTNFTENAAPGYVREPASLLALSVWQTSLLAGVTFSGSTTAFTVTQRAFYDAPSGGNQLLFWNLLAPVSVRANGTDTIPAGGLIIAFPALVGTTTTTDTIWSVGAIVGFDQEGVPVTTGSGVQVSGGVMSAVVATTASAGGLPAVTTANTVTSFGSTALLPLVSGGAQIDYIAPLSLVSGVIASPALPAANALASGDVFLVDQHGPTAAAATAAQVFSYVGAQPPGLDVRAFIPAGASFGTGSSQPLSGFFASLAAAQLLYPFATSLTQELDACAIQLALDTADAAGGGIVRLPACSAMINFQIKVNTAKVRLAGTLPAVTLLLCQGTGATPPLHLSGQPQQPNYSFGFGACVLSDMTICAKNTGPLSLTPTRPGSPATGFVPGTSALLIDSLAEASIERVKINGFDVPTTWGSYAFCIEFVECSFDNNNKGIVWPQNSIALTLGENIRYRSCYAANNNYGVYFDGSTDITGLYTAGIDLVIDACSIDYNNVQQICYIGSGGSLVFNRLLVINCHIENNAATMGNTNVPVLVTYGKLVLSACVLDWQDNTPPPAFVDLAADEIVSEIVVDRCAFNGATMPVVGANVQYYSVYANSNKDGSAVIARNTGNGYMLQTPMEPFFYATFSRGVPANWMGGVICTLGNITLTLDTTLELAAGSSVLIRTADTGVVTLVQNSGSVVLPGTYSNQLGGFAGAECRAVINQSQSYCLWGNLL